MPDHGPIKMFQGPVANVKTTKKDGSPLITSKGNPWAIIGFKQDDGSWLNLSSFDFNNNALLQPGAMVKVGYTEEQQVDGFGQPKMYNGQVQWNRTITAVALLGEATGATQTGQNAQPTSSATPHSLKAPFDAEMSPRQTAANDATQILVAMIRMELEDSAEVWTTWADLIHDWLTGKSDKAQADAFKAMHEKVEETLDATPEQAGPPEPASSGAQTTLGPDEDIPFLKG